MSRTAKPAPSPLRRYRRARAMNQEDLARLAGITQETLSRAERGMLRLGRDIQAQLATILGVAPHELFPEVDASERARVASAS